MAHRKSARRGASFRPLVLGGARQSRQPARRAGGVPQDADYNDARQESNPAFQAYPQAIVYCVSQADVRCTWKWLVCWACRWRCARAATARLDGAKQHDRPRLLDAMTNPAGAAIVNAIGPLRKSVQGNAGTPRRYLVIAPNGDDKPGVPVQVQR